MIEATELTKRYGAKTAVDGLSFTVRPGVVTGFLGPNGAGKSTTMRMVLGLDAPTAGDVTVDGRRYRDLPAPLHKVGALLEARAIHTGRSAANHLLALAQTHGIRRSRVDELIDVVGLHDVAKKRAGQFSLGMGQRLGIATARSPTRSITSSTRRRGIPCVWASASRWLAAERPGWMARASSSAPTSCSGAARSR